MAKIGAHSLLFITIAVVSVWFSSSTTLAQRSTNQVELLRLSEKFKRDVERRRTPLYYELLQSTNPAVRALNLSPDVELMYIGDNGVPVYYVVDNIDAAITISTDEVWPGGGGGYSLTGFGTQGYQFAIWEGRGVLISHQEFGGRVNQVDSPSGTSNHSTHVAGTLVAAGVDSLAQGMSYEANLDAYDWLFDESEMAAAAALGLQVSNHSYGPATGWNYNGAWYWWGDINVSTTEDYRFGFYTLEAAEWDEIAYNAPNYLIVQSAGNDRDDFGPGPGGLHLVWDGGDWVESTDTRDPDPGTDEYDCLGERKGAKNILTVGAVDDIPSGYTQPSDVVQTVFSSWGPTDDGRIKPDIVANGASLYSTSNAGDDSYTTMSGTSMSCPNAAGSINLLVRHYEDLNLSPPRAATMKAVVINTADEAGLNDGPDYQAGWGLINTQKAADVIQDGGGIVEMTLSEGLTHYFTFTVDSVKDVRVTIAWTDIPDSVLPPSLDPRDPRLVNDLDVRVERIASATTYEPWVLDVENPDNAATQGDNLVDNVEQIDISDAQTGDYRVAVSHKGSLVHGPPWDTDQQDYSIVSSEDITYTPTFHHYVSESGSGENPYDTPARAAHAVEDAILAADTGDTVFVESDTFIVSLDLNRGIVLSGAWDASFASRDLETGLTVLDLSSNITVQTGLSPVVIDGFIIENGQSPNGGGIEILNSDVTIKNSKIQQNEAYNAIVGMGGGVYGFESTIHVIDSEILSNTAVQGGGIYLDDCSGTISNTLISDNGLLFGTQTPTGGGVCIVNSTGIVFSGNTISNNMANIAMDPNLKGGGIYLLNSTGISLSDDVITGNEAGTIGSGGFGGGIRLENSGIDMARVTISRNEAKRSGGGVSSDGTSTIVLRDSKVMWNSANRGGGLYLTGSESTVEHNLFIGNAGTGCAIFTAMLGSFVGNTLDRNSGTVGAGAFFSDTSIPVFNNIIVNSEGVGMMCSGTTMPTPTYNDVWNSSVADYSGCTPGVGAVSSDPLFADTVLVDYRLTIHSPAIDAGDPNPAYDDPDGSRGDMGWYGSHVFTMDQPEYVKNASVTFDSVFATLSWDPNPEADIDFYAIYKDTITDFIPSADNIVQLVAAPDTFYSAGQPDTISYFKICAIDTSGYAGGYSASAEEDPTGIGDAVASRFDFELYQNYPNPFNPRTTIQFTLDIPAFVRLDVFNVAGQRVATVFAKHMPAGTHRHTWMPTGQASGVYFYRLKSGARTVTRRMVLLK